MNTDVIACWSTASFGHTADPLPLELSALKEHLKLCRRSRGRLFALLCLADKLNGFVAARFVTTMLGVVSLIGVASLLL